MEKISFLFITLFQYYLTTKLISHEEIEHHDFVKWWKNYVSNDWYKPVTARFVKYVQGTNQYQQETLQKKAMEKSKQI